ncbi:MAG: energy transducer TonB [Acidobacteria bacterium]|nr:energy transducer TonB [Acidobacteriota bacterium]
MKLISNLFLTLGLAIIACSLPARAQQPIGNKSLPQNDQQSSPEKSDAPAADLVAQGKSLYRTAKFKLALAKFEAALGQEPDNDEALGLAAETAFRLDSQGAARDYFLKRAGLPGQKDSVKAYSYHRAAMTCWREAHDLVAKYVDLKNGKPVPSLPESTQRDVSDVIAKGLEYASRALSIRSDFADAYNIRNLLNSEAALAADTDSSAKNHWQKALDDVRMALSMSKPMADSKAAESADFNYPTIRISEFSKTAEEQNQQTDEMMKILEGGKPLKRVQANFRSTFPSKSNDPDDSAFSGKVKVEVLISTEGKVIFTHIIDGRSDLNSAAILAARGWTFEPAMLDGQPVQISSVISFETKLARAQTPSSLPSKKP